MLITKRSILTNKEHTRDIPMTPEQYRAYLTGNLTIQNALPFLSDNDREFLLSGATPEEWDEEFGDDDGNMPDRETFDA